MHELSIALRVIEIAREEAARSGAEKITGVELEVGELSGVMIDALEFAFSSVKEEKGLENLRVDVHIIPAAARCRECGKCYEVKQFYETCPVCGGMNPELVKGRELKVKSVTVEQPDAEKGSLKRE